MLNNLFSDIHSFPSVADTKVGALLSEVHHMLDDLHRYDDGDFLTSLYKRYTAIIKSEIRELKLEQHADSTVAHYLNQHTTDHNRLAYIKRLLTFDSALIDLKILHEVHNMDSMQTLIAFAGGAHIKRVSSILEKMGYEQVYTSDSEFIREYNLKKCLGSRIVSGSYCLKPKPIDVRSLGDFF